MKKPSEDLSMLYYMQAFFLFTVLFLSAFVAEAIGGEPCLDNSIRTVKTQNYIRGKTNILRTPLIGEELAGYFLSKVKAKLKINSQNRAQLSFSFATGKNIVGLPYHINKVAILLNADYAFIKDFTNQCQSLGFSLFPQAKFFLPSFSLPRKILERCKYKCPLKLVVWGGFY